MNRLETIASLSGLALLKWTLPGGSLSVAYAQAVSVPGVGPVRVESERVRVVSVDHGARNVIVEQRGRRWLLAVLEEFGSLAAVRRRDRLDISRVAGVAVSASPARNARADIAVTGATTAGSFDGLPARWVQRNVTVTGKFVSLNPNNLLTIEGPDGRRAVPVVDPAVVQSLRTMRSGDMVDVVFAEAVQVVLTPRRL